MKSEQEIKEILERYKIALDNAITDSEIITFRTAIEILQMILN